MSTVGSPPSARSAIHEAALKAGRRAATARTNFILSCAVFVFEDSGAGIDGEEREFF